MVYYKDMVNKFKFVVLGLMVLLVGEIIVEKIRLKFEELLENLCCLIVMFVLMLSVIYVNIFDMVYDVLECMSIRYVVFRGCIEDYVEYFKIMF